MGPGWEGTQTLMEDMDKGTFPSPTTISLQLGVPGPLGDV